ncbi:hypothetical protein [Sansalvadorimonas verongulae]|uniref:hypothetical protein n=1 Tax=Sansalvadorimonas verongulae TaxID=2172824 RepID=UPI0012BC6F52|nr:hypothetical protein [Sansalvadorimonas verongulae]MTI12792.1 hypothetical protein [Sansalvadorimonas verongulae]
MLLSRSQLSKILGISPQAVAQNHVIQRHVITTGGTRKYKETAITAYLREVREKSARSVAMKSVEESKARKAAADAESAEIDLEKKKDNLVAIEGLQVQLNHAFKSFRDIMLALPRTASIDLDMVSSTQAKSILLEYVTDALNTLADRLSNMDTVVEEEGTEYE